MKRIDLNAEDYLKYYPTYFGYESKIYRLSDDTLLKVFNDRVYPEKKLLKLEALSELDMKENIFKDLVYVNDEFIGYTMGDLTKKGYKKICCCEHFKNKKIEIAKLVWERIQELHDIGITYGDIREANILYNGKDIMFCDMDNVRINEYSFDTTNPYHRNYLSKTKFKYDLIDNYIFNVFLLGYYQNVYMPAVYEYLDRQELKGRLNNDMCKQIAHDMIFLDPNYTGELFIDNLNDTFATKLKRTLHK